MGSADRQTRTRIENGMLLAFAAARRALTVRNQPVFHEDDYLNPVVGLDTTGRERL
ncbi:hypothetical protein [Halococcus sp. AFM35]|uniref:hypothetical protein n=1 Tax=Halococcus sp. AFM35 TaxID=3421653 RepID=UPI003EBD6161